MPSSATTAAVSPSAPGDRPAAVIDVLRRADRRWADKRADEPAATAYLEHLATFLEPHLGDQAGGAAPSNDDVGLRQLTEKLAEAEQTAAALTAERDQLAAQVTDAERQRDEARAGEQQAREDLAELTKKTGTLRADYAAAAEDNQKLADQLAAITAERDQLGEHLAEQTAHQCRWEWPDPDRAVLPCECGRPFPRYLEEIEDEDDEPAPEPEPWEALFSRIRDELAEQGWGGER